MKIEIQIANSNKKATASLMDNQTARDFYVQMWCMMIVSGLDMINHRNDYD